MSQLTFIDLFAGIGGFHLALTNIGCECLFASEWDSSARQTYQANFGSSSPHLFTNHSQLFAGDITQVSSASIPDFDILTAGFPCQPFSQAGHKKGFAEARGTLFFEVARIIKDKQPRALFLENVRGLLTHNSGKTFATIKKILTQDLGYSFFYKIIRASDFGVPQHRPRLFMVGFRDPLLAHFSFPAPVPLQLTMSDIFQGKAEKTIGFTLRVGGRGSPRQDRRNWEFYLVDGKERRLTSKEGLLMQGFPSSFILPTSEIQAMKQLGNSVAVPAIQATAQKIIELLP